jgi:indole-3-glycerol phosphate synthase
LILDDIIAHKRGEVQAAKAKTPLDKLQKSVTPREPGTFVKALSVPGRTCLIAEIKKASPSRGLLRADFDPSELARTYEESGASAISVLTDAKYFQGDASHLKQAKAVSRLPVLRKDFIVDAYQIWESVAIGADAILLIVAALGKDRLCDYVQKAYEAGLDALVEVHDKKQLDMALLAGARIIGINNRDLRTFRTHLEVTLRLAPEVPDGNIIVSESGIHTREDVRKVAHAGVHAILVGEALVTSTDIPGKIRELIGDQS